MFKAFLSMFAMVVLAAGLAQGGVTAKVQHAGNPDKRPVFDVGDTVEVVVTGAAADKGNAINVQWVDSYSRVVAQEKATLGDDGKATVRFPVKAVVSTGNRIEVRSAAPSAAGAGNDKLICAPVIFACSPQDARPVRDWYTCPWAAYPAGRGDALRAVGCNGQRGYGTEANRVGELDTIIANDLRYYVDELDKPQEKELRYFTVYKKVPAFYEKAMKPFYAKWDKEGVADHSLLVRKDCLSDPETLARMDQMVKEVVSWHAPLRPLWYNMQDEGGMAAQNQKNQFCYCKFCMAGMRKWLKEQYVTLDALNEAWGTTFASWEVVEPMTSAEVAKRDGGRPVAEKKLGPFCDHRDYMDIVMLNALAHCRAEGRKYDPQGLFGMTGTQGPSPWPGFDYSLLPSVLDIAHYYDNANNEMVRSFAARNGKRLFPYPGWFAGAKRCRYDWYFLFHGGLVTGLWDPEQKLLDKDGRPTAKALGMKDTWLELQRGIGRLFINAQRDNDPVAIYFSQPSLRVQAVAGENLGQSPTGRDANGAVRALQDVGVESDFVAYWEVEKGLLAKGNFKLLVLLNTVAMSDAEAKAVRQWVADGGVLVTERRAGMLDQHGRGRAKSALADLVEGKPVESSAECDVFAGGKGKVVLIKSVPLASYAKDRVNDADSIAAVKAAATKWIELAGLKARFPVLDASGKQAHGPSAPTFTDGPARYVAVYWNTGGVESKDSEQISSFTKPAEVKVVLGNPMLHKYNIRAGKYLGTAESETVTLDPIGPQCFALLPYKVAGVEVSAPGQATAGQEVVVKLAIKAEGEQPVQFARHVLRVDVLGPDGAVRTCYSRNIETEAGKATLSIPLALNDAAGTWVVRVKDIATGTVAEAKFEVK
jgi:hypothetical protein